MILFTTLGDDVRKSKTGPCLLLKIYHSGPRPNVGILKMLENVDIPKKSFLLILLPFDSRELVDSDMCFSSSFVKSTSKSFQKNWGMSIDFLNDCVL